MGKVVREVYFFDEPGEQNTDDVVEAVAKRVEAGGIGHVIVASTSGETATRFAKALEGKAKIFCVSEAPYRREWNEEWPCLKPRYREELEKLGVTIIDRVSYVFHSSVLENAKLEGVAPEQLVKETLYSLGQGLKVAVEVVLIAVSQGYVEPYQDVIGVGGSGEGADTAAVIHATYPAQIFHKESGKRLEIREIIAMPYRKKWWE
ncbi:MAG: pyruvate kinase alpha/beta domain-containing protein [Candidatus Bathyarchaeia archaeon]